jgi:hypothetical protein
MTNPTAETNPVIRETALRAYPGWIVRQYADGMFDSTNGRALSPGERSFADAVYFAKHGEPVAR